MTATKQRILDAAQEEFSAYGLAGARIDRIAKNAKASKERMYAYFGDKENIFHAVLDANLIELMERHSHREPGDDLPDFAATVFEETCRKPQLQRMIIWGQLQGESVRMREQAQRRPDWSRQMESIRRAQAEGLVTSQWEPEDLITLIFGLVFSWMVAPGVQENDTCDSAEIARRKAAVQYAATRLCTP